MKAEREDAEGERRRRGGLIALAGSSAIHVALFFSLVMPPPSGELDLSDAMASVVVDIAVPGLGAPGAPAGDAPSIDEPDALAEELDAPVVPPPRAARPVTLPTTEALPTELAEEGTPADVAETAAEAGTLEGDALIDALISRSSGTGAGAGGNGGAGCPDAIAGTWFVRRFRGGEGWWTSFTLHIERDGEELAGRVVQHGWTGGPDDSSPPRCAPGMFEHRVRMGGEGWVRGNQMRFDAVGPPARNVICMGTDLGYNLDRFTGTLRGNRILAVNNDGGRDVNAPYTFRRTSCD